MIILMNYDPIYQYFQLHFQFHTRTIYCNCKLFYPQRVESLGSKACITLGPSDRSYPRYSSFIVNVDGALNDLGGASNILIEIIINQNINKINFKCTQGPNSFPISPKMLNIVHIEGAVNDLGGASNVIIKIKLKFNRIYFKFMHAGVQYFSNILPDA